MKKFKIGDKVEIPKQKTKGQSYVEFLGEMSNYKLDYLLIGYDYGDWYSLKRDDGKTLGASNFFPSDLQLYEEKYTIDYIKKNKIVVRLTTAEQWNKVHKEGGRMAPYRQGGAIYDIGGGLWIEIDSDFYTEQGYMVIDYSQIKFLDMKEQFKGFEGRKLIGYKCPYDLFGGNVRRGVLYVNKPEIIANNGTPSKGYYPENSTNLTDYLPAEIVTSWEPVYEEEFKAGDWVTYVGGNGGVNTDKWVPGKVTGQVIRVDGDVLYVSPGSNHIGGFRKATNEEIEAVSSIVINGHKAERKLNGVAFGCQIFNKDELLTIQRLFHKEINAKITIHRVEITNEIITKLLQL